MPIFFWMERYRTHIVEIDNQHQQMVQMVNGLYDALKHMEADQTLYELLARLEMYAMEHFATEEHFMEVYEYPGLAEQREQHQELMKRVLGFEAQYKTDNARISIELLDFLASWLDSHMMVYDLKFGAYCRKHGFVKPHYPAPPASTDNPPAV